ncbi:MAG: hypothetical protein KDC75_06590, partial [Phaeodactylibacter sp.]|nr:hypothetical protein [Phaeodactylibacter sp.]
LFENVRQVYADNVHTTTALLVARVFLLVLLPLFFRSQAKVVSFVIGFIIMVLWGNRFHNLMSSKF